MKTVTAITIAALTSLPPTITCLVGIILSRQDLRNLRTEMNALRADLLGEFRSFRADFRADLLALRKDIRADRL